MAAKIILVTGASSGFGRLAASALGHAGHTVYASMRETAGRNAAQAAEIQTHAKQQGIDVRPIELDVSSQPSVDAGIEEMIRAHGRIDVLVHNAGHMAFGPAFTSTRARTAPRSPSP
jgi:NAD(P)-dependent dehydrogenase (short-subunit alcohol dehydrogenase family)